MTTLVAGARQVAATCLRPLMRRAARAYVAGEHLSDALATADRLSQRGLDVTLGYWDSEHDSARDVANAYLQAIESLDPARGYLSIKLPALRNSYPLLVEITKAAVRRGVRLHCDALDIDATEATQALVDEMRTLNADVSYTLPGRWRRSLTDATWAQRRDLRVRVVKGQWADPADPQRDLRAGYLEVIDQLAGTAREVAVATHDEPLAAEAIRRLQAAGTPCTMELLYGLPLRGSLKLAQRCGLPVRVYVPYGASYLPYALGKLRGNPRMAWWLLKDLLGAN